MVMFDCDKFDWFLLICLSMREGRGKIRELKDVIVERNLVNRENYVERDAE